MEQTIQRAIESYQVATKADLQFRGNLCAAINTLPQNPDIISVKDSPCVYYIGFGSIMSSEGHIMDPGYHNFSNQKKTLNRVVSDTENYSVMMGKLREVSKKGRLKNDPSIFHPRVRKHVDSIISQFPDMKGVSEEMGE